MTETSEKGQCSGNDMKKLIKQFRMPFKSTSPNLKKKAHNDNVSTSHKPHTAQHPRPKKNNHKLATNNNLLKHNTEVGPAIRKTNKKPERTEKEKIEKKAIHLGAYKPGEERRSKISNRVSVRIIILLFAQ